MKKNAIVLVSIAAILLFARSVVAQDDNRGAYFEVSYGIPSETGQEPFDKKRMVYTAGVRFTRNFGLETSVIKQDGEECDGCATYFSAEMIGAKLFIPVGSSETTEIVGTISAGTYDLRKDNGKIGRQEEDGTAAMAKVAVVKRFLNDQENKSANLGFEVSHVRIVSGDTEDVGGTTVGLNVGFEF